VSGVGCRVSGEGFRIQDSGFRKRTSARRCVRAKSRRGSPRPESPSRQKRLFATRVLDFPTVDSRLPKLKEQTGNVYENKGWDLGVRQRSLRSCRLKQATSQLVRSGALRLSTLESCRNKPGMSMKTKDRVKKVKESRSQEVESRMPSNVEPQPRGRLVDSSTLDCSALKIKGTNRECL